MFNYSLAMPQGNPTHQSPPSPPPSAPPRLPTHGGSNALTHTTWISSPRQSGSTYPYERRNPCAGGWVEAGGAGRQAVNKPVSRFDTLVHVSVQQSVSWALFSTSQLFRWSVKEPDDLLSGRTGQSHNGVCLWDCRSKTPNSMNHLLSEL